MIKVRARYSNEGKKISDEDMTNIIIRNENITNIINVINHRITGDSRIE